MKRDLIISVIFCAIATSSGFVSKDFQILYVILGVCLLVYRQLYSLYYFFSFLVFPVDTADFVTGILPVSVHTVAYGITLFPLWMIAIFAGSLCVNIYRKQKTPFQKDLDLIISLLCALFLVGLVVGLENAAENLVIYISDFSYLLNLVIPYVFVRLALRSEDEVSRFAYYVVNSLGLFVLISVFHYLSGDGRIIGHIVKPVADSFRNVFPLLLILAVCGQLCQMRGLYHRIILWIIAPLALFQLLLYSSRGNYVLLLTILVLLFAMLSPVSGKESISFLKVKLSVAGFLIVAAIVSAIEAFQPGILSYVMWKLSTLFGDSLSTRISSSDVRQLSFLNIWYQMYHEGGFFFGTGLGGYFSDKYFPFIGLLSSGDAFPDEWIETGKLYKPHGTLLVILLKFGLFGLIFYLLLLSVFFVRVVRHINRAMDSQRDVWIFYAFSFFLPLLFYKNFTTKLQIFMGLLMGIIALKIYYLSRRNECELQ